MTIKNTQLADLIFPNFNKNKDRKYFEDYYFNQIKKRERDNPVLRLAPSPTGELHIGTVYLGLLNKILTEKSGTFIIRIEDTDTKREVVGAKEKIIRGLDYFNIKADEGFVYNKTEDKVEEIGEYGPYTQSERKDIYDAFIYDFLEKGLAYPSFATEEELAKLREMQTEMKLRTGYYGDFAKDRNLSFVEIREKIEKGQDFVIRFKSDGDFSKKIDFEDKFVGALSLSVNDEDFVISKKDKLPTYHLAHLLDDYLMRINLVTRANEWISSITKHLELWEKLGIAKADMPDYIHIMPINKKENSSVRKLSKRKDPEASVDYFIQKGYLKESVVAYLIRLMCPTFDDYWIEKTNEEYIKNWNIDNSLLPENFIFNEEELKRNSRGPVFDFVKLSAFSSDLFALKSAEKLLNLYLPWLATYDKEFYDLVINNKDYLKNILNIERETEQKRKDITTLSEIKDLIYYFYDSLYESKLKTDWNQKEKDILKDMLLEIKSRESKVFNQDIILTDWIVEMKDICKMVNEKVGEVKFGEMMMILRLAISNETKTPNLFYIFKVLPKEKILNRIENIIK